jgi:hypothetical protein
VAVADYFGNPLREAVIAGGLVLLIWVPRLPSLAAVNRLAGVLAGSSLYIYLTHWQIYPHLQRFSPLLATLASLAAGAVFGVVVGRATRRLGRLRTALRARRRTPADAIGRGQFALAD